MAQKVTVVLEDDLTGGPAEQTIRFAFEGTDYEIDLNARKPPRSASSSRPTSSMPAGPGGHRRRAGRAAAGRQRSGDIRAWAKEHGLAVSERGHIPASVVEQYNAAAGASQATIPTAQNAPRYRDSVTAAIRPTKCGADRAP